MIFLDTLRSTATAFCKIVALCLLVALVIGSVHLLVLNLVWPSDPSPNDISDMLSFGEMFGVLLPALFIIFAPTGLLIGVVFAVAMLSTRTLPLWTNLLVGILAVGGTHLHLNPINEPTQVLRVLFYITPASFVSWWLIWLRWAGSGDLSE